MNKFYLFILIFLFIANNSFSLNLKTENSNSLNVKERIEAKTNKPPSTAISQCVSYSKNFVHEDILNVERFLRLIEDYSMTIKSFKKLNIASDRDDASSPLDQKAISRIIDTTLKFQTSYFQYPTIKRANNLKTVLKKLFNKGFLSELDPQDDDPRYVFGHFLAISLHSFDILRARNMFTNKEKEEFELELKNRFHLLEKDGKREWFYMKHCKVGSDLSSRNCANHTYYEHYLRTLYGYIFNDETHFHAGEDIFKFALDDSKNDIGLWREASRGYWSWQYYSIALTDLAGIAEIYRRNGIDLYSYRSKISGLNYSDLVNFYVSAIKDPNIIYKYASRNHGLVGRESKYNDLTIFNKVFRSNFPERSNWYYLFKGQFEEEPIIAEFEKLTKNLDKLARYHFNLGFNPQCDFAEKILKNKIKNEVDIINLVSKDAPKEKSNLNKKNTSINLKNVKIKFHSLVEKEDFIKFNGSINDISGNQFGKGEINFGLMFDFKSPKLKDKNKAKNFKISVKTDDLDDLNDINDLKECKKTSYWEDNGQIKEINIQIKYMKDNKCIFKKLSPETVKILSRLSFNMIKIIKKSDIDNNNWRSRLLTLTKEFY